MLNQKNRQLMIENLQDSLRLVRHLMKFGNEQFAEAIGETRQIINDLESKKIKMSPTQYVAISALIDSYFENHEDMLFELKTIIDSDGKNYEEEYETSFKDNSLLKRWFEDFIDHEVNSEADTEIDSEIDSETDSEINSEGEEVSFKDDNIEKFLTETGIDLLFSELAAKYKIFLDVKTFLSSDAKYFFKNLAIELTDAPEEIIEYFGSKIIVPMRSIEELRSEASADEFEDIVLLVKKLQNIGIVKIFGEETDSDFYLTIYAVFEKLREKYDLCLITPNEYLAYRILPLRKNRYDEREFAVETAFFKNGELYFYDIEDLEKKFEDRGENRNTDRSKVSQFVLDPEYMRSEFDFGLDAEDEEKEIPNKDENKPVNNKFQDWGDL